MNRPKRSTSPPSAPRSVLFVCLGNICRSPLAEGIFRACIAAHSSAPPLHVDSAGTGGWHVGEPPDPRSCEVARRHGISLEQQRARRVQPSDFETFDLIVAMDANNLRDLEALQRQHGGGARLARLRDWDPDPDTGDVPDPYYGRADGFAHVFTLVERACRALANEVIGSA